MVHFSFSFDKHDNFGLFDHYKYDYAAKVRNKNTHGFHKISLEY